MPAIPFDIDAAVKDAERNAPGLSPDDSDFAPSEMPAEVLAPEQSFGAWTLDPQSGKWTTQATGDSPAAAEAALATINPLFLGYGHQVEAAARALADGGTKDFAKRYGEHLERISKRESDAGWSPLSTAAIGLPTTLGLMAAGDQYAALPALSALGKTGPTAERVAGALTNAITGRGGLGAKIAQGAYQGNVAGMLNAGEQPYDPLYSSTVGAIANPLVGGVFSRLVPEGLALAKKFINLGIPVKTGQLPGAPLSTKLYSGTGDDQIDAFHSAVSRLWGEDTDKLGPAIQEGQKRLGQFIDQTTKNYSIAPGPTLAQGLNAQPLNQSLMSIWREAQNKLAGDPSSLRAVQSHLANVADMWANGRLTGEAYKGMTAKGSPLWQLAYQNKNPTLRYLAGKLDDTLDDAWKASLPPQIASQWDSVNTQYKALKSAEDAFDDRSGTLNPKKFFDAVEKRWGWVDRAPDDIATLARGGNTFLGKPLGKRIASEAGRSPLRAIKDVALAGFLGNEVLDSPFLHSMVMSSPYMAALAGLGAAAHQGASYALSRPGVAKALANGGAEVARRIPNWAIPLIEQSGIGRNFLQSGQ